MPDDETTQTPKTIPFNPEEWRPAARFNEISSERDRLKTERESITKEYEAFKAQAIEKVKYDEILAERDRIAQELHSTRIQTTLLSSGLEADDERVGFLVDRWKKAGEKAGEFKDWFEKARAEDKLVARLLPQEASDTKEDEEPPEQKRKAKPRVSARAGKKPESREKGVTGADIAKMSMEEYKKYRAELLSRRR